MYSFDRVYKAEDVARMPDGSPACGQRHFAGSWSYKDLGPQPAVVAFIETDSPNPHLILACRKHAGHVKSQITRGSYSGRGVKPTDEFGIDLGVAVADPAGTIKRIMAAIEADRAERQRASEERDLAYRRENWAARRDEYLLNADVEFKAFSEPDEYGRVFVNLAIGSATGRGSKVHLALTPQQVRKIVAHAGQWADNAERLTLGVLKP